MSGFLSVFRLVRWYWWALLGVGLFAWGQHRYIGQLQSQLSGCRELRQKLEAGLSECYTKQAEDVKAAELQREAANDSLAQCLETVARIRRLCQSVPCGGKHEGAPSPDVERVVRDLNCVFGSAEEGCKP